MQPPVARLAPRRIAELVQAYLVADYRWEFDGDWLNLRIGTIDENLPRRYPDATSFGLLSAWDPYSEPRPEAINRAADAALQEELADSGHRFRAAFSSSANRNWREPSWLVLDMPVERFDTLSRRYGQLATLYWTPGEAVRLRVDQPAPVDFPAHPALDWIVRAPQGHPLRAVDFDEIV